MKRLVVAGVAVGAGAAGVQLLRDDARRDRVLRSLRVYRLTARRATALGITRLRGIAANEERRARLDEQFAIRSAQDVTRELGQMKGAIMKAGQLLSFLFDGLPPEAQEALATLQADVEPMAPSLAESVVADELGDHPERIFLEWEPEPTAAASIGQVHRAVLADGRRVAVKVQYPGVDTAIRSDLDNAEMLYGMFSQFTLKGLDVHGVVDELRARMADELDYRIEARCQQDFVDRYAGHPFISVPAVVAERSSQRVLTTEWADGLHWAEFEATAGPPAKARAAEVVFRFAQGAVHRYGTFNGDPHPGNYLFGPDGSVTFIDFGLVKSWAPGEFEGLEPCLDPLLDGDPVATVDAMITAGFLQPDHGLDPALVWEYVSRPYVPYLDDQFAFTPGWAGDTIAGLIDLGGPYAEVIATLNLPPSFVILDRVVWGVSALLGRLEARNQWRGILAEYRHDADPCTDLGRQEAAWRASAMLP